MTRTEVAVVGGGPAGSFVAHALAAAGVHVTLLDRARFPREKPCAEFLSPECTRLLAQMGALDACVSGDHALLAGLDVRSPGGAVIRGEYGRVAGTGSFRARALSIRRQRLDAILLARAGERGAHVHQGTRVIDVLCDASGRARGVTVLDARGRRRDIAARMVIGADGLRSVVALRLGLRRRNGRPRRLGIVGHWEGIAGLSDLGEMHVQRDGYFGVADTGGGIANVSLVVPASRAGELRGDPAGFYERYLRAQPHFAARLYAARRVGRVLTTGPFAVRSRPAWGRGAALAGDAADYFDPFTGEGVYSALRAGELLAPHALAALDATTDRAGDDALRAYDRERSRELRMKRLVERAIALFVGHAPLMEHAASALTRSRAMADLLVAVCGDFVPPSRVLHPGYLLRLLALPWLPGEPRHQAAGCAR